MMKSPEAVMTLLETVGTKIKPLVEAEMATLRELSGGETIHFWDLAYYGTLMLLERNLDSELVAEYFPADFVLERMLEIFERLFHLDIEEIADRAVHEVWHPDVKMYKVREVEGPFVGYLYMDLYPREGKYNHAADFSVRPVSPLEP
jgi:metallopeptidase MepB